MSSTQCTPVPVFPLVHVSEGEKATAVVVPAWGANVIGFSLQAEDWKWPLSILESVDIAAVSTKPTSFGMPVLCPTPGRVGKNQSGEFYYNGSRYRIVPSRHGFLRQLGWTTTRYNTEEIVCAVSVTPENAANFGTFPFHFHAEYKIAVGRRSLTASLCIENTGRLVQPISVGWHPYIARPKRSIVGIPATARWELDGETEPVPTGRIVQLSAADSFCNGRLLHDEDCWDDVFTGLPRRLEDLRSWVEGDRAITRADGRVQQIATRTSVCAYVVSGENREPFGHVQLYTPAGRAAISLEPLSAPPDALNLIAQGQDHGDVCQLEPGHCMACELRIYVSIEN